MGSSQSTQRQQERHQRQRRSSNRLSKPPRSNSSSAKPDATGRSPTARSPREWRDPWTRNSAPEIVLGHLNDDGHRRVQSLPSYSVMSFDGQPPPTPVNNENRSWSYIGDSAGGPSRQLSRSSSQASNFSLRRSSVVEPGVRPRVPSTRTQPQRTHSYHFEPQDIEHPIQESPAEEAKYHQDFISIDSQRFSLIRRKSLLTPGLATRAPEDGYRHSYSEPLNASSWSVEASRTSQWPLGESEGIPLEARPTASEPIGACSPNEREYSHLGSLRFGSLRVVNGASSPSPSDRSRRQGPSSAKQPRDRSVESSRSREEYRKGDTRFPRFEQDSENKAKSPPKRDSRKEPKARPAVEPESRKPNAAAGSHNRTVSSPPSMLRISSQPGEGKASEKNDVPDSPFSFEKTPTSFEKTPTLPAIPRYSALFPAQVEDEGIHLTDNDANSPEASRSKSDLTAAKDPAVEDSTRHVRRPRPGNKSDSGYSSTTSVWSIPEPRKRDSIGSQTSQNYPYWRSSGLSVDMPRDREAEEEEAARIKESRRKSSPELGEFGAEAGVRRPTRMQRLSTELTRPRELSLSRKRESRREETVDASMCRESGSRSRSTSRFSTSRKPHSTARPQSTGKESAPRFYADLPPGVTTRPRTRDSQKGQKDPKDDASQHKRRFSTSQLKNGLKNLLIEAKTGESKTSSSKTDRPADRRASLDSRNVHNMPRTSRSVEPRSRQRARSDPYGGSRPVSESHIPRPVSRDGPLTRDRENRGSNDRASSRSPARQRSPRVPEDVPPIPTLPTMDEIWKKEKRRSSGLLASVMSLDELQRIEHRRSDITMLADGSKSQPALSTSPPSKDVRREDRRRSYHENARKRESMTKPGSFPGEIPSVEERRKSIPKLNEMAAQAHQRSVSDVTGGQTQIKRHSRAESSQNDDPRGRTRSRSMARSRPNSQTRSGHYVTSLRNAPSELFEQQRPRPANPPTPRPNGPRAGPNTSARMSLKLTIPRDPSPDSLARSDFIDRYPKLNSPKSARSNRSSGVFDSKNSSRSRRSSVSSEAFTDKSAQMRSPRSGHTRAVSEVYDKQARMTSPQRVTSPMSARNSISSEMYDRQSRMMPPSRMTSPKSVRSSVSSAAFSRMSSPRDPSPEKKTSDFVDRYPKFPASPKSAKSTRSVATMSVASRSVASISETLSDERRYSRFSFESGVSR